MQSSILNCKQMILNLLNQSGELRSAARRCTYRSSCSDCSASVYVHLASLSVGERSTCKRTRRPVTSHDTRNSGPSDSTCEACTFWWGWGRRSCPIRRLKSSRPLSERAHWGQNHAGSSFMRSWLTLLGFAITASGRKVPANNVTHGKNSALKCKHNCNNAIVSVGKHLARNSRWVMWPNHSSTQLANAFPNWAYFFLICLLTLCHEPDINVQIMKFFALNVCKV